jgi:hypothetical protein
MKISDILGRNGKKKKFLKQWIELIGLNQVKDISITVSPIGEYKVVNILRKDGLRTLILIPNEALPREKETS